LGQESLSKIFDNYLHDYGSMAFRNEPWLKEILSFSTAYGITIFIVCGPELDLVSLGTKGLKQEEWASNLALSCV